jgi:hypothetical protein
VVLAQTSETEPESFDDETPEASQMQQMQQRQASIAIPALTQK